MFNVPSPPAPPSQRLQPKPSANPQSKPSASHLSKQIAAPGSQALPPSVPPVATFTVPKQQALNVIAHPNLISDPNHPPSSFAAKRKAESKGSTAVVQGFTSIFMESKRLFLYFLLCPLPHFHSCFFFTTSLIQ